MIKKKKIQKLKEKKGLSYLASKYLGKFLDKGMQLSDWARRPLMPSQFQYSGFFFFF